MTARWLYRNLPSGLVFILIMVAGISSAGAQERPTSQKAAAAVTRSWLNDVNVSAVDGRVLVEASGEFSEGCWIANLHPAQIPGAAPNTWTITIRAKRDVAPEAMCTQVITPWTLKVELMPSHRTRKLRFVGGGKVIVRDVPSAR